MSPRPKAAELPLGLPAEADPELEALPEPRRPGRKLTLVLMAVTAVLALGLAVSVRAETRYALGGGEPRDLGELTARAPDGSLANHWVRGEALLGSVGAIRYARPLESDTFRLAPVAGNDKLWVEIRVPAGLEDISKMPYLTAALLKRGYSEADLKKILGGNHLRVLRAVTGK